MSSNEKKTNGLTIEEKLDLILEKLDQLLKGKENPEAKDAEGPKDPPPTPPNP